MPFDAGPQEGAEQDDDLPDDAAAFEKSQRGGPSRSDTIVFRYDWQCGTSVSTGRCEGVGCYSFGFDTSTNPPLPAGL